MKRRPTWPLLIIGVLAVACGPVERDAGRIEGGRRSPSLLAERDATRRPGPPEPGDPSGSDARQILFGDLHVHSTFSIDAFMYSLPVFGGEGAHPPADACDFARHCSGLDFFSINDHAEGLTPDLWRRTKHSIRECNALAGDPEAPDLVAFMGWEWTQTGPTPEQHFGHKNLIFPGLDDAELPARPISSVPIGQQMRPPLWLTRGVGTALGWFGLGGYGDVVRFMGELGEVPDCEPGVPSPELPAECRESATTPAELFAKLDEWGLPSLVIPHGLAWGIHAPPGAHLGAQLSRAQHDPARQRLIEVMSGHGNGEEFRSYPEHVVDAAGQPICPAPGVDYLPCCWRAGEIMRERCGDLPELECELRVERARQLALEAGVAPQAVFPDTSAADWLDCDQCRDCFKPALSLRPGQTAQYGAAISSDSELDARGRPLRFRWGFIGSTDNHASRPGTGYKQYERQSMTDSRGIQSQATEERVRDWFRGEMDDPRQPQPASIDRFGQLFEVEREASYLYPGGIVAVHSQGRDRAAIWEALVRREVYGTSGPRILLWFDLLNGPEGRAPMGSEVELSEAPRFEVRAVGSFEQRPGCPEDAHRALSGERLHRLCRDECYHPGSTRRRVAAIEVIRIRPRVDPAEPIADLIEDPWLHHDCPPDPAGCRLEFGDPEHAGSGRDAVYYARVLEAPSPAINAAGFRALREPDGTTVAVSPCYGGWRTPTDDPDCLSPVQERAWSSPIYVDQPL